MYVFCFGHFPYFYACYLARGRYCLRDFVFCIMTENNVLELDAF
jgi:hypothetical protein